MGTSPQQQAQIGDGISGSSYGVPATGKRQNTISLLIVDDSKFIRAAIKKLFAHDSRIQVVGEAANGREALAIIPQLQPDVITLDVNMPEMDGLLTLKHIMIKHPTPTVMISSLTVEGATKTFDALRLGAIDFIAKPAKSALNDMPEQQRRIVSKVKLAADVKIEKVRLLRTPKCRLPEKSSIPGSVGNEQYVVFGASEGGYGALLKVIPQLKPHWPAVYFAVLYAEPLYVDAFAQYLNNHSAVDVQRAVNGMVIRPGACYLAAGSEYITAAKEQEGLALQISPSPFPERRGAINILMLSLSELAPTRTVGVILSGQEQDGAEGAAEIVRVGGKVIIQAPQTCLFKEMAQAAIGRCAAGRILSDVDIADAIKIFCQQTPRREEASHVEKP